MTFYNDNPVPKGPTDLCFDTSSFIRDSFSVDQFLQDHRNKATLEIMRDDLGLYLKVLRSAMIDLINKDYADFVNLSSNLIGLDKAINDIQLPLGQLREELLEIRQSLDGAAEEISSQLSHRRELREHKRSLRSLSRVHTSLKKLRLILSSLEEHGKAEIQLLERVVSEYSHIQFHISRCKKDLSDNDNQVFDKVGRTLVQCVDNLFLEALYKGEKGKSELLCALSLYQALDKLSSAEGLYRKQVSSAMENLISEEALRSSPTGLPGLYNRILSFLDTEMKCLCEISAIFNKSSKKNKCDFFLRSFWPEVEERLETNLTSIYSPGDPDIFHQKYTETLTFLEKLLNRCDSTHSVQELQAHPNFLHFMERWDLHLPVYFQIRFQEIVRDLEMSFQRDDWLSKSDKWKLLASETVWKSLNKCWEEGIFLRSIAHKFWKLSLQIISRFTRWAKSFAHYPDATKTADVDFLVFLYSDIQYLLYLLPEFKKSVIEKLFKISEHTLQLLTQSLEESGCELESQLEVLNEAIIKALSGNSALLIRQVNDIPRLFRRTNREPPTKPCTYVVNILETPGQFYEKHKSHSKTIFWLTTMFSIITKQYYSSVSDVLDSVQKTEESLRRLKKARDRSSNLVPNDRRVEDDNKIRLQLLLDINAYVKGIEAFGINKIDIEKLSDLLLLVEADRKSVV